MKVTIHRGSKEVGGNCVEIQSGETRVILDIGMPLFDKDRQPLNTFRLGQQSAEELRTQGILPNVPGLFDLAPSPNAILLSHAHLDHTGLLGHSSPEIPVWASPGTSKMMLAGSLFAGQVGLPRERFREIKPEQQVQIGCFRVTGYSVDHSIYGCLAYMMEAEDKRILYTGDLRSHGRKPGMQKRLVEICEANRVDALLMEGTHFGFPDGNPASEYELEAEITKLMGMSQGLVLASFSPQHIDRLVAFIRAAKETGRTFVVDVYTAFIMYLLKNELSLPQPAASGAVRVYVPKSLQDSAHRTGRYAQIERFRNAEITLSEIRKRPEQFLMMFRASMLDDFEGNFPHQTSCLYSRWQGYLDQPDWKTARQKLTEVNGIIHEVHTSGHILSRDIASLVQAINPRTLVPIHTFEPEHFRSLTANVTVLQDGEPWTVP